VKVKHNKKRNTAFLFEVLVKELTKSIVDKDPASRTMVSGILKENFQKRAILAQELECYRVLLETTDVTPKVAEKLLVEVKKQRGRLDSKNIFDSQTRVINKINKTLSTEAWNTFVPNYKSLATVSAIFNEVVPLKQRILYEETLITSMYSEENREQTEMQPIDNIIYKSFVEKYNTQYSSLLSEQKNLLGKYIASFGEGDLELKLYLNEEIGRLKDIIKSSFQLEEIAGDKKMFQKSKNILSLLESYKESPPSEEMISKVLKIQNLVQEIQSNDKD
tara:strand:+ start:3053 stop:3883 length:831 start_codon:yes stop_codon:yes gene_type:complete